MRASRAGITEMSGANSCGARTLRGMQRRLRDATSWQMLVGERVALHRPDRNSLNGHTFAGKGSSNPSAGNDLQSSALSAANSFPGNALGDNRLRGSGSLASSEKAIKIGKHLTRTCTLVRWCKFNFVGAVGIFVQFGVLFLFKSVLRCNYLAATALAVEAAVVHNFFWHERFTWADRVRPSWGGHPSGAKAQNLPSTLFAALKRRATQKRAARKSSTESCATEATAGPKSKAAGKSARPTQTNRFGRFLRFNLTAGLVSIAGNLGMMRVMVGREHMNYLVANGIAIAVCSVVNFVVSDGWVFEESETSSLRIPRIQEVKLEVKDGPTCF